MGSTIIRGECPEDIPQITRVTEQAFCGHPHSDWTEHLIILALRRAGALSVSLVAELDSQIVGHIAFSPVRCSDASPDWYGLGPVAVAPPMQRTGIGNSLVAQGLEALRSLGAQGCVVLGDPEYYGRFGFKSRPDCLFPGLPPEYFQALSFGQHYPTGTVTYHEAFDVPAAEK